MSLCSPKQRDPLHSERSNSPPPPLPPPPPPARCNHDFLDTVTSRLVSSRLVPSRISPRRATFVDVTVIRCQFPFRDRVVTVCTFAASIARVRYKRKRKTAVRDAKRLRKRERKRAESQRRSMRWGSKGNARETKTNQASVCWRVDPMACGEGRTLTLLNTRMPHARTAGVYRVTRNLWVCYGVSRVTGPRERPNPRYERTSRD